MAIAIEVTIFVCKSNRIAIPETINQIVIAQIQTLVFKIQTFATNTLPYIRNA